MKFKLVRQSGRPVEIVQLDKFQEEFKISFDKIIEEYGQDMKVVHEKLEGLDGNLADKYDTIHEAEFPRSKKAWNTLTEEYGNVMVTAHAETGEMFGIIMDQETVF